MHRGLWPLKLPESKLRQRRVFYWLWSYITIKLIYHTILTRILTLVAEGVPPPQTISRDCSGAVSDGELKLGRTDASFKPDMSRYLIFAFVIFCDVTNDVTGVFLGHQSSSSITSDHIEEENRERNISNGSELPNRLICDFPPEVNPWPDGGWLHLDLRVNLDFDLYQVKGISFDARGAALLGSCAARQCLIFSLVVLTKFGKKRDSLSVQNSSANILICTPL